MPEIRLIGTVLRFSHSSEGVESTVDVSRDRESTWGITTTDHRPQRGSFEFEFGDEQNERTRHSGKF